MEISAEDYIRLHNILPQSFAYEITYAVKYKDEHYDVRLNANIFDKNGVNQWVEEFKKLSKMSWVVRSTPTVSGTRVIFKRKYGCVHQGRNPKKVNSKSTPTVRNTNCPASLIFCIAAVKKKSRCKQNIPNPLKPCQMYLRLSHNHSTDSIDMVRFRKVSDETKEKLRKLYRSGHTAATAWDSIKKKIREKNPENCEILLADRSICPDYQSCYRLYMKEFNKGIECVKPSSDDHDPLVNYDPLINKLTEYNKNSGEQPCASWELTAERVIIAICTPLMKRAHKLTPQAAEIVFVDSSGSVEAGDHRIFIFLTHNEGGGVPLGVVITSSEDSDTLEKAFSMLKVLVGADGFFSVRKGPAIFMINDCDGERKSLSTVWPASVLMVWLYHVLHAVWRWLQQADHGVPKDDGRALYRHFKSVAYAQTEEQCYEKYQAMQKDPIVCKYKTFLDHIASRYWDSRWKWAVCYFHPSLMRGHHTGSYAEAATRVLKDNVFERIETKNLTIMVDSVLNWLDGCYERKLLDAAHNRPVLNAGLDMKRIEPPTAILQQIQDLGDNAYRVPSESSLDSYVIDAELHRCECLEGGDGALCKHQVWLAVKLDQRPGCSRTVRVRKRMYFIATGKDMPAEMIPPLQEADWEDRCKEAVSKIAERLEKHIVSPGEDLCLALEEMADTIPKIETASTLISALRQFRNAEHAIQQPTILFVQPPSMIHGILMPTNQSAGASRPKRASPALQLAAESLPGRRRLATLSMVLAGSQSTEHDSVKSELVSKSEPIANG